MIKAVKENDFVTKEDYINYFKSFNKNKYIHLGEYNFALICKHHGIVITNIKNGFYEHFSDLKCHFCKNKIPSIYNDKLNFLSKENKEHIVSSYTQLLKRHYLDLGFSSEPLTIEQFYNIKIKKCSYCGSFNNYKRKVKHTLKLNGIDRINSKKGYEFKNCQPCCGVCNMMKKSKSHEEFVKKIKSIYKYLGL